MANKYGERRWSVPSKRAKDYASERKNKVHEHGAKEGKQLTDYEAGFAPDTCKHNRITQVCTSTKRLSVKANPNPRQEQSLVLSGRKNKEEISNG